MFVCGFCVFMYLWSERKSPRFRRKTLETFYCWRWLLHLVVSKRKDGVDLIRIFSESCLEGKGGKMDGRKLSHQPSRAAQHQQPSHHKKRQFNKNQSPTNFHYICPEQSAPRVSGKDLRLSKFLIGQPSDSRGPFIGWQPLIPDLWPGAAVRIFVILLLAGSKQSISGLMNSNAKFILSKSRTKIWLL